MRPRGARYGAPDEADQLLREFVQDLTGSGHHVVGLIQTRLGDGGGRGHRIAHGRDHPARRAGAAAPHARRPCPVQSGGSGRPHRSADESGADLVIINQFGKLEAEGTGLIDEIARALSFDIPVLVAVAEFRFPEWLSFCGGMGVKLPCRKGNLQSWWNAMIVGEQPLAPHRQISVLRAAEMRKGG